MIAICVGCGCTDSAACWDDDKGAPCHWDRVDREAGLGVCSSCKHLVDDWDSGVFTASKMTEGGAT